MAPNTPKKAIELFEARKLVQTAHASGKRLVEIDGKVLRIKKIVRRVRFQTGGQPAYPAITVHNRTESWFICKPADGSRTPVYCIEATPNSRTI